MNHQKTIIVGITGASGAVYGQRLVDFLAEAGCDVHVIVTAVGRGILADESGVTELNDKSLIGRKCENLSFHENDNLFNSLASGSFVTDGMVICPCSSHSLASIAAGLADSLLLRTAYVTIKQRRPLILAHRETPLTGIDLENMQKITRAGGIICPASPAFYMKPKTIADLTDSFVGRILDLLKIKHDLPVRWNP